MATILEALQNADINVQNAKRGAGMCLMIAAEQLHNAVELLDKGYALNDEVELLIDKHGSLDAVPFND
jgi:hypothetical protein